MRLLAIDYGTNSVGLAISDELRLTARPLATIRVGGKLRGALLTEVKRYVTEYEVAEIVVGLPINMDGTFGHAVERAMKFIAKLRTELKIPVHTIDERLTSRAADERLRAAGAGAAERRSRSDQYAALIILEDFLASSHTTVLPDQIDP